MVPDDFIENRRHILRAIKNKVKDEAIVKKANKGISSKIGYFRDERKR